VESLLNGELSCTSRAKKAFEKSNRTDKNRSKCCSREKVGQRICKDEKKKILLEKFTRRKLKNLTL
jgi:hypothetical protein